MSEVTKLLNAIQEGDVAATDDLFPVVYQELRRMAAQRMAYERPGHTLQPTALVHEAYIRLVGDASTQWNSRGHFFSAASEAMRRILIDRARLKKRDKHGGRLQRVALEDIKDAASADEDHLLLVHEALDKLAELDPDCAELVKLRFFGGLSMREASQVLGIPERSAGRSWAYGRSWLYNEISKNL